MYLLGLDIGSSSVKAALVEVGVNNQSWVVQSPESEMKILSPKIGWAEQQPEAWWENVCLATRRLLHQSKVDPADIKGIGISYQMHGLVIVDDHLEVLRPSIIWCDGRAVEIGNQAFDRIGHKNCLSRLLNAPGNFTASKLKWVQENETAVYDRIYKMMLPGDYIAMKLTGSLFTTPSGLSEGILWDFNDNRPADLILDHFTIDQKLIPEITSSFSQQGILTKHAAQSTGLVEGTPVTYRAGDQPNNALSLNVLEPGEVAASGGTSGVVYGVVDKPVFDQHSRVNGFAHVNHTAENPKIGILLCINGAGIQYAWVRQKMGLPGISYSEMESYAADIPIGSDQLRMLPFGNGAERMLGNKNVGARALNLQFNRHSRAHFYRAALEGIAYSFVYGVNILKEMGLTVEVMRVGNDNLFRSNIFSKTISNLVDCRIEMIETTGAIGAAKAAGVAAGIFSTIKEAVGGIEVIKIYEPNDTTGNYQKHYRLWETDLLNVLSR
ncbi:MAG: FGGY family carbohydrate kinase [Bacteroidota bacterium]